MLPRVHSIHMGAGTAHLIEHERCLVLVDAGVPRFERTVLRAMQRLGRSDLRLIFITHAHLDHYGSAAALRRLTGAPIAIHHADEAAMAHGGSPIRSARGLGRGALPLFERFEPRFRPEPTPPDVVFGNGDTLEAFGLDAAVLHTPGHTDGSSCLIAEDRIAFAGDLLSGRIRPHVQNYFAVDWSLLPASLRRLQAARPELVYIGHSRRPVRGEALQGMVAA